MLRLAIFLVASIPIVGVSWRSLRNPRSHGFYRFFTFEFILVLILLNAPPWFKDPLCARQLVSWVLLLISAVLPVQGAYSLWKIGRPEGGIERTTTLVTVGIYKHIRHPLYASFFYAACGVYLKDPSLLGGVLALATSVFAFLTARVEETEMLSKFGADYAAYMKRTTRFVPFVF
ncbi:MAG: methyltransferase family protein [Planctomycetota bacterium]